MWFLRMPVVIRCHPVLAVATEFRGRFGGMPAHVGPIHRAGTALAGGPLCPRSLNAPSFAPLDRVVGDKAALGLNHLGLVAKLYRLAESAFDDGSGIRVGEAHNPVREVTVTSENGLVLGDDLSKGSVVRSRCATSRRTARATSSDALASICCTCSPTRFATRICSWAISTISRVTSSTVSTARLVWCLRCLAIRSSRRLTPRPWVTTARRRHRAALGSANRHG